MRLLVVGASSSPTCGVRDHAAALGPALHALGVETRTVWWERNAAWGWRDARRSAAGFIHRLGDGDHDAAVWHYAVFDYGLRTAWDLRGLPVYAPRFARALAGHERPLVAVLHECAYRWSEPGWQRKPLAAGHRAALLAVVAAADGTVLTTAARERWLQDRRWLPRRPRCRIPVCATLRPPEQSVNVDGLRLGVFGFGADDARADVIVGAVRRLRQRGHEVEIVLLGAPGGRGARAERWRTAARSAGCESALSFSGILPAERLAEELAAVDVVAFPHASGSGAGKTTLGSALAFAKPVIALDGAERWDSAVRDGALLVADPTPAALADRLEPLLTDELRRARQAAAGHAFFRREMDPAVGATRLLGFVDQLIARR
jgi:glycosyltransferase involved in cell wall biosynthesis